MYLLTFLSQINQLLSYEYRLITRTTQKVNNMRLKKDLMPQTSHENAKKGLIEPVAT